MSSILLARAGKQVLLIERKSYPQHKVCGEYVSNEVAPFLQRHNLFPEVFEPAVITRFVLSNIAGKEASVALPLGGFGISRYCFDHFLYEKARESGVAFELGQQVENVEQQDNLFKVGYGAGKEVAADLVIGAFGKRSKLDKQLGRSFIEKRSPWIGVKYHIKTDFRNDTVALYNFPGGYCGLVKIEGDKYNLCYLSRRENLKETGSISTMEEEVLHQNPLLKSIFRSSDFLDEKPEVINEISFEKKETAKSSVLMVGDSAGLITPLCGNGMAIAIHSAKLLSDIIISQGEKTGLRTIEALYYKAWNQHFAQRLWVGRRTQNLFGSEFTSTIGTAVVDKLPGVARKLISYTHGQSF